MKCVLCEDYFIEETNFLNMFVFEEVCPKCIEEYSPKLLLELIPYSYGIIDYFYIYDEVLINGRQKLYLNKHFRILYLHILANICNYDLVIIIDNITYNNFQNYFNFLKGFKKLLFVSLLRWNFEVFMNFL